MNRTDVSLKAFHILFITLSTALAAGFSAWCAAHVLDDGGVLYAVGTLAGLVGAVALLIYGVRFLERFKGVGYL